jgi:hypothetical protein
MNKTFRKIWVKLIYHNLTSILTHDPTEEKYETAKEEFYTSLEEVCHAVPKYMKTVLADFNATVRKKSPICTAFTTKQMQLENEW